MTKFLWHRHSCRCLLHPEGHFGTRRVPFDFALPRIACKPLLGTEGPEPAGPRSALSRDGVEVPSAAHEGLWDTTLQKLGPNAGEGACAPDPLGIFILHRWGRQPMDPLRSAL